MCNYYCCQSAKWQKPRNQVKPGPNHTNYAEESRDRPRGLASSEIMTLPGGLSIVKVVGMGRQWQSLWLVDKAGARSQAPPNPSPFWGLLKTRRNCTVLFKSNQRGTLVILKIAVAKRKSEREIEITETREERFYWEGIESFPLPWEFD